MTIASEIQRIKNGIAAIYTKLEEKGATLPEEQSLENICDTVDSVPAGSGGGYSDFSEAEFRSACAEIEEYMPSGTSLTTTAEHNAVLDAMESNGWIMLDGKYGYLNSSSERYKALQYAFVATFSYSTKYVWISCGNSSIANYPVAFKIPNTAELVVNGFDTEVTSNKNYRFCIKFNGDERTILFAANSYSGSNSISNAICSLDSPPIESANTTSPSQQYGRPFGRKQLRAIKYYDINAWTASNNPDYYGLMLENMSAVKIIESGRWVTYLACGKQTSIPDINYLLPRVGNAADLSFLKDFYSSDFYDDTLGVIKALSDSTFWNSTNLRKYLLQSVPDRSVFPILVDMSGDTSTGTWQPFNSYSYGGYVNGIYMHDRTVYIKLPSTYTTVDLNGYTVSNQSKDKDSPCLTLESWQYMANNAPTVSSKTLKVGNQVYHMMKTWNIPEYVAIATTFQNKGWTISAT